MRASKSDLRESISHVTFTEYIGAVDAGGRLVLAMNTRRAVTIDVRTGAIQSIQ